MNQLETAGYYKALQRAAAPTQPTEANDSFCNTEYSSYAVTAPPPQRAQEESPAGAGASPTVADASPTSRAGDGDADDADSAVALHGSRSNRPFPHRLSLPEQAEPALVTARAHSTATAPLFHSYESRMSTCPEMETQDAAESAHSPHKDNTQGDALERTQSGSTGAQNTAEAGLDSLHLALDLVAGSRALR